MRDEELNNRGEENSHSTHCLFSCPSACIIF